MYSILIVVGIGVMVLMSIINRYHRCPSDKILVVYDTSGTNKSAKCVHGGGKFVWPVIQDYAYLSLTPNQHQAGDVYQRIPGERRGEGKVQYSFHGSVQELAAITNGREIPCGAKVRVLEVIDNHTLLVEQL